MLALESASHDFDIEPDHSITSLYEEDKIRLTKYYGLVPRHLLEQAQQETDAEEESCITHCETKKTLVTTLRLLLLVGNDGTFVKS